MDMGGSDERHRDFRIGGLRKSGKDCRSKGCSSGSAQEFAAIEGHDMLNRLIVNESNEGRNAAERIAN